MARVTTAPGLRRVLFGYMAFAFAEHATWLAILVYALERGGPREVGIVAVAQLLPGVVVAPFAAFAGDRFLPHRALSLGYAAQAAAMAATAAAMASGASLAAYVAATVTATCITFTRPVMRSLLPKVTHSATELVSANVVAGFIEKVGVFLGPIVAGALMVLRSPTLVFVVAATLVAGAFVATRALDPAGQDDLPAVDAGDVLQQVFGGFRTLRREHRVRLLVMLGMGAGLLQGVADVIFVTFAHERLGGGSDRAGWLAGAYGLGAILGAIAISRVAHRPRVDRSFLAITLLAAATLGTLAGVGRMGPALLAFAALGATETSIGLLASVTVQRSAPPEVMARVFGVHEGLQMAAIAAGSFTVAVLTGWTSMTHALLMIAAGLVVAMGCSLVHLRRRGAEFPMADHDVVDRLLLDPVLAPLPSYTVERVANSIDRQSFAVGSIVVAQGDTGDRYYLITSGSAVVTIDGVSVAELGPGHSFGEIALLRDVPRTASVTARTPLATFVIGRTEFLEAVTGHPASRRIAEATVNRLLD